MKKRLLSVLLAWSVLMGALPVYALEDVPTAVPAASAQEMATVETADPLQQEPAATQQESQNEQESAATQTQQEAQDPAAASQEDTAQEEVFEVDVTVDTSDADLPDNDELFALYLQQQMYPDRVPSTMANWGRTEDVLNADELAIYNTLREYIEKVAKGEVSSTEEIPLPFEHTWTYEELGLKDENDENLEKAVTTAVDQLVDTRLLLNCLLVDCPADLYWFDKTVGIRTPYSYMPSSSGVKVYNRRASLAVVQAYSDGTLYGVDTAKTGAAQTALAKAQEIVSQNKDKTTYQKLLAYKNAICDLTSYNHEAADTEGTPYGDPWQLIYVFDGDPSTNVVCEGYSKAFQYLCDLSGIPCYTVTGVMQGGTGAGRHMWNIVPLDGKNYLVDVTNCDAGTTGYPDLLFLKGATGSVEKSYVAHGITYTYDKDIISLYNTDVLTLSDTDYDPNQTVHTHSYDADGFCECGFYQPAELQDGVYQIGNAGNFFWFAALVNGDTTHAEFDAKDIIADAVLTQDINLQDKAWTAIGEIGTGKAYAGIFDGQGHSVSGLNPEGYYSSLFGSIDSKGMVENLILAGVTAGSTVTGGIAFHNYGTIRYCGNLADLTPDFNQAGGIVNNNESGATIENCYNLGNITGKGEAKVGGIASSNNGTITGCYNVGKVQSLQNSRYVGGIAGLNQPYANVTNCYYLDTSANTGAGEGSWTTGNATAKTQTAFASGEVTYLLNGENPGEANVWRQNLDNGNPKDTYPVLSADHGIVYAITDGYSNTEEQAPQDQEQAALTVSGWQQTPAYGDVFALSVSGGSGSGALRWTCDGPVKLVGDTDSANVSVQVTGVGGFSVTVTKAGDATYTETSTTLTGTASARTLTVESVTAEDKTYDGAADVQVTDAVLATPVTGDDVALDLAALQATVNAADAGTYQAIHLNNLKLTGAAAGNYTIASSCVVMGNVTIAKAEARITTQPQAVADLIYNGQVQTLITAGTAEGGTIQYSMAENGPYSEELPKATDAGEYTVWYKVSGDANHTDIAALALENAIAKADPTVPTDTLKAEYGQTLSEVALPEGWTWVEPETELNRLGSHTYRAQYAGTNNYNTATANLTVNVTAKTIEPTVTVEQNLVYTGQPIVPAVTVRNGQTVLQAGVDYTVSYRDNTDAGEATVTITAVENSGYTFEPVETRFTIAKATAPQLNDQTVQYLVTETGEKTLPVAGLMPDDAGTLTYAAGTKQDDNNLVTDWSVAADGTVRYTLSGQGSAGDTAVLPVVISSTNYQDATVQVVLTMEALQVPVASAEAYTKVYDGQPVTVAQLKPTADVPGSWAWKGEAPRNVADSGEKVLVFTPDDTETYTSVEVRVRVTITKADAQVTTGPQAVADLTYNGQPQTLITAGAAEGGTLLYALAENGPYSEELPTATDAGEYTVWYKVTGDANHADVAAAALENAIAKADPTVPADALTATYGDTLSQLALPEGWTWQAGNTPVGNVGENTFTAIYAGDKNYKETEADLTVQVLPRNIEDAQVTADTDTFVYNGAEQQLTGVRVVLPDASGTELQTGTDFTVTGSAAKDAGSYQATLQGKGNYTGTLVYDYTVQPKTVAASMAAEDKVYDGTTDAVVTATADTGVAGETLTITGLKGTFARKDVGENLTVAVDATKAAWNNGNYTVTFSEPVTASITPAAYTYAGVADQSVKLGNGLDAVNVATTASGVAGETIQGSVTWYQDEAHTQPLPAGYVFSGQEGDQVTLYWVFTPDATYTNYSAAPQSGSTAFVLSTKAVPQVSAQDVTKTYDGKAVTLADLKPEASVPGTWALNADTPELKNVGEYSVVLHFTPDATQDYTTASIMVTVKVEPRLFTVGLELSSNQITTGEDLPTARLVWSGALEGEDMAFDQEATFTGWPESKKAGYYSIHWANCQEMMRSLMAKPAAANYRFQISEYALLTVTQATLLPDSDERYRLEATEGLPYVPRVLQQAGFPTAQAVVEEMFKYAVQQLSGVTLQNTVLHDVTLYYSADGGKTWMQATKDNFPAEGIRVTLPYPDGTNATDFDFVVTHMLTTGTPGAVETLAVTKADNGLQFTVHSLSPIAISWQKRTEQTNTTEQTDTTEQSKGTGQETTASGGNSGSSPAATPAPQAAASSGNTPYYTCPACGYHNWTATDEGYRCDHCGYLESVKQLSGYGNVQGVYEPKSGSAGGGASTIAQTGDDSNPALWGVLLVVSALALGGLTLYRRKRNH